MTDIPYIGPPVDAIGPGFPALQGLALAEPETITRKVSVQMPLRPDQDEAPVISMTITQTGADADVDVGVEGETHDDEEYNAALSLIQNMV